MSTLLLQRKEAVFVRDINVTVETSLLVTQQRACPHACIRCMHQNQQRGQKRLRCAEPGHAGVCPISACLPLR